MSESIIDTPYRRIMDANRTTVARGLRMYGVTWVARRLKITPRAVEKYAAAHDLPVLYRDGYVRVHYAADLLGLHRNTIVRRAEMDGALYRPPPTKYLPRLPAWVNARWLDDQRELASSMVTNAELIAEGDWFNAHAAARYIGVGPKLVVKGLEGEGPLAEVLKDALTSSGTAALQNLALRPNSVLIHPQAVEAARVLREKIKRHIDSCISQKALAAKLDLTPQATGRLMRALGYKAVRDPFGHAANANHYPRSAIEEVMAHEEYHRRLGISRRGRKDRRGRSNRGRPNKSSRSQARQSRGGSVRGVQPGSAKRRRVQDDAGQLQPAAPAPHDVRP